ncbi:MAG TPA: hypothetical protein VIB47_03655 [Dehalococcoidia bacterium]|jgi:hypothetical protein
MSQLWKLMPLAVVAALGTFMLLAGGGGVKSVQVASANIDCDTTHRLRVQIIDDDTDDPVTIPGMIVRVSPDPIDGSGNKNITDNGSGDDSSTVGLIQVTEACEVDATATPGPAQYTITLEDELTCDIVDGSVTTTLTSNQTVDLHVDNCPDLTPTATATTTSSAARTVVVQTANQSLGCANTTIITITVRGANGQPVAAGTLVNIQASIGAVSPTSGQTTADGSVFVFYTAPQNQGGTATITALAGSASGSTTITINCATAPTQAPPATTAPTTITPPSTGDGGISGGGGWQTYAGIAMIVASVITTLVVVRPRA